MDWKVKIIICEMSAPFSFFDDEDDDDDSIHQVCAYSRPSGVICVQGAYLVGLC